jgi:cell division protein FtsW (lipid II flippase)
MELDDLPLKKIAFVWWPFCIYSGWISVALIANVAAWLTKIKWDGFGISEIVWTLIMIIVAGIVNLLVIWKRNMREFALAGVWALIAIAVANWNGVTFIVYVSVIVAAVLFINISIHGYKNRRTNPWKKHLPQQR